MYGYYEIENEINLEQRFFFGGGGWKGASIFVRPYNGHQM